MPTDHDPLWKHLVMDWQKPVYNLARRMLGNAADAEDATQDAFIRLFQQLDRYDTRRPLGPWVYRVATNVVLNRIRRERVRARGRVAGAPEPVARETPVEPDRQALVQSHLESVPPDARAALVLHFHLGLSKSEIAELLDLPRTTVQSRFAKGLDTLRDSLARAGHVALAPMVEGVMRDAPALAVPSRLSDTLLSIAAESATVGAAGAAAVGSIVIGGTVITKQLMLTAAMAAILLLGTGYVAGRVLADGTDASVTAADRDASIDGRPVAAVAAENERLRAELDAMRASGPSLESRPREASTDRVEKSQAVGDARVGDARVGEPGASAKPAGVDFSSFAKIMAENLSLLLETQKLAQAEMTRKQERAAVEVLDAYMRVSREARALTRNPFFDDRVLPGFVDSVYSAPLGLSEGDRAGYQRQVEAILRRYRGGVELEEVTAVERFRMRQQVMRAIDDAFASAPDPENRLEDVRQVARRMMAGGLESTWIGVTEAADERRAVDQVIDRWKDVYDIEDRALIAELRGPAAAFVRNAVDTLKHHGLHREGARWDPQAHGAVADAMVRAQIEAERTFLDRLTEAQRALGRNSVPNVILFHYGEGSDTTHMPRGL